MVGNTATELNSGIRIAVLAELEQNVDRFKRFWEKLENQRVKTINQSMEQAFIESSIPSWLRVAFDHYIGSLNQSFRPFEVRTIHRIYAHLENLSCLQTDIQQAQAEIKKVVQQKLHLVEHGVYNSTTEPVMDSEIARLQQKSGEAWIDLDRARREIESAWISLQSFQCIKT